MDTETAIACLEARLKSTCAGLPRSAERRRRVKRRRPSAVIHLSEWENMLPATRKAFVAMVRAVYKERRHKRRKAAQYHLEGGDTIASLREQLLQERASQQMCVGAAGIGDFSELCGWIDRMKEQVAAVTAELNECSARALELSEERDSAREQLAALTKSLETVRTTNSVLECGNEGLKERAERAEAERDHFKLLHFLCVARWPQCDQHRLEEKDANKNHCPQCLADLLRQVQAERDKAVNDTDEEWLSAIGKHWIELTGQPWMTSDGETRLEGLQQNVAELIGHIQKAQAERDEALAACEEMRRVLERSKHENLGHRCSDGWFIERDRVLSLDCGRLRHFAERIRDCYDETTTVGHMAREALKGDANLILREKK